MEEGRYFLHEHPSTASSWSEREMLLLAASPSVKIAQCKMCRFGMEAKDEIGTGLVSKPTKFMTNSNMMFNKMNIKCKNSGLPEGEKHRHVHLISGRARQAQIYPKALCRAVCEGIADQKKADKSEMREIALLDRGEINEVVKTAYAWHEELGLCPMSPDEAAKSLHEAEADSNFWATDDVTGEALDPTAVKASRAEEIRYFRSMGVYRKVSL